MRLLLHPLPCLLRTEHACIWPRQQICHSFGSRQVWVSREDTTPPAVMLCLSAQVVHCDLKAKNILLNKDRTLAKIGDVGLARIMAETHLSSVSGFFGTFAYTAPEVLGRKRCDEKVLPVWYWKLHCKHCHDIQPPCRGCPPSLLLCAWAHVCAVSGAGGTTE